MYSGSITMGVGQFCTNPGLIIGVEGDDLVQFINTLAGEIKTCRPGNNVDIRESQKRIQIIVKRQFHRRNVMVAGESEIAAVENQGVPTIASAAGRAFLSNPFCTRKYLVHIL
jgi:NADP-dependent aldehyde dehydrogenase